jgi:hypothetical protein
LRSLNDVFGENDPVRRRKAIDEIFTQDAVFYPKTARVERTRFVFTGQSRFPFVFNQRVLTWRSLKAGNVLVPMPKT